MMVGSFLALSIQRSTVCFFGNSRTRLRLLASRILSTRCCGLRNLSSLTVLTPTARNSSEYSQPTPFDPHAVGGGDPAENALGIGAGHFGNLQPLFRRLGRAQKPDGGANPLRLEDRGRVRPDAPNVGDRIRHRCLPLGAPLHQLRKASERNNGLVDHFRANLPAGTGEDFAADALYLPRCSAPPPSCACPRPSLRSCRNRRHCRWRLAAARLRLHRAWPRAGALCLLVLP